MSTYIDNVKHDTIHTNSIYPLKSSSIAIGSSRSIVDVLDSDIVYLSDKVSSHHIYITPQADLSLTINNNIRIGNTWNVYVVMNDIGRISILNGTDKELTMMGYRTSQIESLSYDRDVYSNGDSLDIDIYNMKMVMTVISIDDTSIKVTYDIKCMTAE